MLTRLYVDNYKCLVNFDLRLGREHLLMGRNGTGKSTLFEVLSALRRFHGQQLKVHEAFPLSTLTRWQNRSHQLFELEVTLDGVVYRYRLELVHQAEFTPEFTPSRIERETVHLGDVPLFVHEPGQSRGLHPIRFKMNDGQMAELAWAGADRSALHAFEHFADASKLSRFVQWFNRIYVVRIDPRRMVGRSETEAPEPAEDLSNLASWYRHLTQERLNEVVRLRDGLRKLLDGFDALVLKSGGDGVRMLRALWKRGAEGGGPTATDEYSFEDLSEGQKVLVGLYALLYFLSGSGATLCLDEPDNFVALSEIQPFLLELREQERIQTLLISHHPEVINLLAPESGLWFERISGGPARVSPFHAPPDAAVPAAEIGARGWEDGK